MSQSSLSHRPAWADRAGAFWQNRLPALNARLADAESRLLADEIEATPIAKPVWITGLPRSGSTILLECLSSIPGATSHRYADYPLFWTPYFSNWLRNQLPRRSVPAVERSHADRIMVTRDSPEAFEELLWSHHFLPAAPGQAGQCLDEHCAHPLFERQYREHIKKLLLARNANRYVAKNHYLATRLTYLAKLFPDALFIIPWRSFDAHLASLLKQEARFQSTTRPQREHLAAIRHYEFGPTRRPIDTGHAATNEAVTKAFAIGNLAHGWALIWARIYANLFDLFQQSSALRAQMRWVHYEALCTAPSDEFSRLARALHLTAAHTEALLQQAPRLSAPDDYPPQATHAIPDDLKIAISRIENDLFSLCIHRF